MWFYLGDKKGLDAIFGRMLAQPKERSPDSYYLALVDYADGLARLDDERAWDYFEEAIAFHPENSLEAVNRYARHLLERGQALRAVTVLDTYLTPEQRVRFQVSAFLRKDAMAAAGLDTASADEEIDLIKQHLSQGPLAGMTFTDRAGVDMETESLILGTEATVALAATDYRVSTVWGVLLDNPNTPANPDTPNIKQDAIFSPNGVMSDRWPNMSVTQTGEKLAAIKWPNGKAGLFRIGTDNVVYYRYFNGSAWQTLTYQGNEVDWLPLFGGSAIDITAVVWPDGHADVFRVDGNQCDVYVSHSTDGKTWGGWDWWGSCGDQITVSVMPDGTAWAILRTLYLFNQRVAVKRYFNGKMWDNFWALFPDPQLSINDIDLLAYSPHVCCAKLTLWAVGDDNRSNYYRNWDGSNWTAWTLYTTGYKQVSSFSTSDGGAYLLLLGTNNKLYTTRFSPTPSPAWLGITQQGSRTWIALAGINIDDDSSAREHIEASDDCRIHDTRPVYTVCSTDGCTKYYAHAVNLAEVMYNEARGESNLGAIDMVGWTVRNRAFMGLHNDRVSCDSYPGDVNWHTSCPAEFQPCRPCSSLPCNQDTPDFCTNNNTKWYCCAIHGGQTQVGTSGYQFNDEHVSFDDLYYNSGLLVEAAWIMSNYIPEVSSGHTPSGAYNCVIKCENSASDACFFLNGPGCCRVSTPPLDAFSTAAPKGPIEFRSSDYCAPAQSCKRYMGDFCGDTDSADSGTDPIEVRPDAACKQTKPRAKNDNFFWNRRP
jgi:hypothetical protein